MADNVDITAGTGTHIAADDVGGGILQQRVKVTWGPDGTGNDTDVATGKPLPVQLRGSDGTDRSNLLPVTDTTNGTKLDQLHTDLATTLAGLLGAQGYASTATFTATASSYSAGNTMAAAQQFSSIGPSGGGEVMITSVVLEIATTAIQSGETSYTLELYNVTPPSALANNSAWDLPSGDRTAHVGSISLGVPIDKGSTLKVQTDGINMQLTVPNGGSLYAYLVTVGGFTATAVARKVTLHSVTP